MVGTKIIEDSENYRLRQLKKYLDESRVFETYIISRIYKKMQDFIGCGIDHSRILKVRPKKNTKNKTPHKEYKGRVINTERK
jgi:ribosomal protein S26